MGHHIAGRFSALLGLLALAGHVAAETATTNILDGVSTNANGPFTLGDTGPFNFLLITNAAALTNTTGTIGNSYMAFDNLAIVTGPGSIWHNDPTLIIGAGGPSNQLFILDGGKLFSRVSIRLGALDPAIGNRLLVSGANSFAGASGLFVGNYSGYNELIVERGAQLALMDLVISSDQRAIGRNRVLVRHPGTTVMVTNAGVRVGSSPNNLISIAEEAQVTAALVDLGFGFGGVSNWLGVAGTGTRVTLRNSLSVGSVASNNLVTLADSAALYVGNIYVGSQASGNRLLGGSGSRIVSTILPNVNSSYLGSAINANDNLLMLQDAGTAWTNAGNVTVGVNGSRNFMILSNGAAFIDTQSGSGGITVGSSYSSSRNGLLLTGPGTSFNSRFKLTIGDYGSRNNLLASEGARLTTASAVIGQSCLGSENVAFLTGPGTVWTNGLLEVGFCSTSNSLVVSNGAQVIAGLVRSSVQGSRSNTIAVTGFGSLLRAAGDLIIGNSGSGNSLLIADGGRVEGRNDTVGLGAGNNAAFVRGAGTTWSNVSLSLADSAPGSLLTVTEGARIDSGGAIIGAARKPSGNTASLSGAGTAWNVATNLILGGLGHSNRMFLANGASVSAGNVYLGADSFSVQTGLINSDGNSVSLQGANTVLSAVGKVTIGTYGRFNRLQILDGAQVHDRDGVIGLTPGSHSNSALVAGAGSAWNHAGDLTIGMWGKSNRLMVLDGARLDVARVFVGLSNIVGNFFPFAGSFEGSSTSAWNLAVIQGSNAVLNASGYISIGNQGPFNRLEIRDGGRVTSGSGVVGGETNAHHNSAFITGRDSAWNIAGVLWVGSQDRFSELKIANGGRVTDSYASVGFRGNKLGIGSDCVTFESSSQIVVTDPGSLWFNTNWLFLGYFGGGNSLIISNGGTVVASNAVIGFSANLVAGSLCQPRPDQNVLTVAGGCLIVSNIDSNAKLEPRFGTLKLQSGSVFADLLECNNGNLGRLDLPGGTLRVRDAYVAQGGPLVLGDGVHVAHLHFEPMRLVNGRGRLQVVPSLIVQPHSLLTGRADMIGSVTNAGTIAPGSSSNAVLMVQGRLHLLPSSALHFNLGGVIQGQDYDSIGVAGPLDLDGSLRVSLRQGFAPLSSDVFDILGSHLLTGVFTNVAFGGRIKTTDNLGSFLVVTNGNAVELTDYQSTDLDGDGIEDAWAVAHFGHSPLSPAERAADTDGDGASGYDEFRAGTDPNDPASVFKATIQYANGRATVSFPCVDGKVYRLWSSAEPGNFTEVTDSTFAYPSLGQCEWTDDGKETGGLGQATRFYRVTVE